ncbi:MAG: helix-turn-helix domain-containing protein [Firmicutes bacterium]|nr:helix-turn-helix domain-containing protein [Bacillota bacterium]
MGKSDEIFLIVCNNLMTTNDVCNAYMLAKTCLDTCHKIYPLKHIFDLHELQFAKECLTILESGGAKTSSHLKPLEHLLLQEDGQELVETLSVFLLDTQSNMQLTGELLFMHKNTVNYRINKIKQRLGHDIAKMPKSYKLYVAVALHRLLK